MAMIPPLMLRPAIVTPRRATIELTPRNEITIVQDAEPEDVRGMIVSVLHHLCSHDF
jgi:hypothetical protein